MLSHIQLAHFLWRSYLRRGDYVIDATCGNGRDAKVLAECVLSKTQGRLICMDIQHTAIENTRKLFRLYLDREIQKRIIYKMHSHEHIDTLPIHPRLIVYNLGYLPKGDKSITTAAKTTLPSLHKGLSMLAPLGVLSVMCYPGHDAGYHEQQSVLCWAQNLNKKDYRVVHHATLNSPLAPSLLIIQPQ